MITYAQIRKLIGQGRTQKAIDKLMGLLETNESQKRKARDKVVILDSQLSTVKSQKNLNLIDDDNYQRETSQINYALLEIINALEEGKEPPPIKSSAKPPKRPIGIYFLAIAILGLAGYGIKKYVEKPICGEPVKIVQDEQTKKYRLKKCKHWVSQATFKEIKPFSNSLAAANKEGVWGYINEKGETELDFKYTLAESFTDGSALVEEAGRSFYIDTLGQCVQNCIREIQDTVFVEGGGFEMGIETLRDYEKPMHWVTLNSFYIDRHEVTNQQYAAFLNVIGHYKKEWINLEGKYPIDQKSIEHCRILIDNKQFKVQPGYEDHPVNFVSWEGADAYAKYYGMRLPTEAEWEYAASGGQKGQHNNYQFSGSNDLDKVAWYWKNSGDEKLEGTWSLEKVVDNNCQLHPVKTKRANVLGLFDMTGNVYEWCADYYAPDYYQNSPVTNPFNTTVSGSKIVRGGNAFYFPKSNQVKWRGNWAPPDWNAGIGFRCVRDIQ